MCQIHFIQKANKAIITPIDIDQMHQLLLLGATNNKDAWGVTDGVHTVKKAQKYSNDFKKLLSSVALPDTHVLVGHNRYATTENVENQDAHPFDTKNYIIMHNGIIQNANELTTEKLRVDSQIISVLLEQAHTKNPKIKPEVAIKNMLSQLEGSFSVMILHKKTEMVYYAKHNAEFYFRLLQTFGENEERILIGSTKDTNLNYIYQELSTEYIGAMQSRKYIVMAEATPAEDTIYKINDAMLSFVDSFECIPNRPIFAPPKRKVGVSKIKVLRRCLESTLLRFFNEQVITQCLAIGDKETKEPLYRIVGTPELKLALKKSGFNTERLSRHDLEVMLDTYSTTSMKGYQ